MAGRRKDDGTETDTPPRANDLAARAAPYIKRIEYVDEEKAERNAEFAEEKKIIFEEAERAGIEPKALKRILARRKFERREEEAREKLNLDEKAQLEALAAAFADTPFGDFAKQISRGRPDGEFTEQVGDFLDEAAK